MFGKRRRKDERFAEDDGRTIADMSQISGMRMSGRMRCDGPKDASFVSPEADTAEAQRPWEDSTFTRKERWMYTLGALKASLLIGFAYLAGLGLLVGLMVFFWR